MKSNNVKINGTYLLAHKLLVYVSMEHIYLCITEIHSSSWLHQVHLIVASGEDDGSSLIPNEALSDPTRSNDTRN